MLLTPVKPGQSSFPALQETGSTAPPPLVLPVPRRDHLPGLGVWVEMKLSRFGGFFSHEINVQFPAANAAARTTLNLKVLKSEASCWVPLRITEWFPSTRNITHLLLLCTSVTGWLLEQTSVSASGRKSRFHRSTVPPSVEQTFPNPAAGKPTKTCAAEIFLTNESSHAEALNYSRD